MATLYMCARGHPFHVVDAPMLLMRPWPPFTCAPVLPPFHESQAEQSARENLVTRNLELENQICFQKSRFFEFTGTNDFSRIQNTGILEDTLPGVFRLYQDLADTEMRPWPTK